MPMAPGLRAWILLLVVGVGPAWVAGQDAGPSEARVLWNALRQRGMNELLEHALTHADEADWVEAQLMRRELRLAIYADPSRDNAEKLAALRDAIDVLDGLIKKRPDDPRGAEWRRVRAADTPIGRNGTDDEVGNFVAYLCTEAASWIHGQSININGGVVMEH